MPGPLSRGRAWVESILSDGVPDLNTASFGVDNTNLTVTEDNGDWVAKDGNGNVVLRYDEASSSWVMDSLSTEDATVANPPDSDFDVLRRREGVQAGGINDHRGINGAPDDGWDTYNSKSSSVTFDRAFEATPRVVCRIVDTGNNNVPQTVRVVVSSISTTGFDYTRYNFGTGGESDTTIEWIATEGV